MIHALQLKLSELANEVEAAALEAAANTPSDQLSVGSPATSSIDFNLASLDHHGSFSGVSSPSKSTTSSIVNASLLLQLQEATAKLQQAELQIEAQNEEISRLSNELCSKEVELLEALSSTQEQESAVQELAYMLAASEANHGALIDTVHAFVSQNVTSLPPTPRDLNTTNGGSSAAVAAATPRGEAMSDAASESAKKLETMVSFWQEKLEAQVAESGNTLKLKNDFTMGGGNSSRELSVGIDLEGSFSKVDEDEDEYNEASSTSSDGETATPPTERKGESGLLPTSSSIGPVTPIQNVV